MLVRVPARLLNLSIGIAACFTLQNLTSSLMGCLLTSSFIALCLVSHVSAEIGSL
jgi:hypothetical protein